MGLARIHHVRSAAPTSNGSTQTFSVAGIGTVRAARFTVTSATADGVASGKRITVGYCQGDGSFQGGVSSNSRDAQASTDTFRLNYDNAVLRLISEDGTTTEGIATFDAAVTDGIRLIWGTAPPSAYLVTAVLWAGEDCQAQCGTAIPNTQGGANVHVTVGFQPDHLECVSTARAGAADEAINGQFDFSISETVRTAGAPLGFCYSSTSRDGFATTQPCGVVDAVGTLARIWRGAQTAGSILLSVRTELVPGSEFDATGFNIRSLDTAAVGPRIWYIAAKYGTSKVTVQELVVPGGTGDEAYTSFGFKPEFVLALSPASDFSSNPTADFDQGFAIGGFNVTQKFASGTIELDAASGTDANSFVDDRALIVYEEDGTTLAYAANLTSFDSDGLTLNFSDTPGDARLPLFYLFALEQELLTGTGAGSFPLATGTGAGQEQFSGTGAGSFQKATGAASGQLIFTGTGAGSFPLGTGAATGQLIFQASGAGSFPLATGAASGQEQFIGTGTPSFPLAQAAGSGQLIFVGTGAGSFPLAAGTGSSQEQFISSGAGILPLAQGAGAGLLIFEATGNPSLPLPQGSGAGLLIFESSGAGFFPLALGSGIGDLPTIGTGAGFFPLPLGAGSGVNGDLLGCASDLDGSRKVYSDLQGSYRLVGTLQGSYDLVSDLSGGVC